MPNDDSLAVLMIHAASSGSDAGLVVSTTVTDKAGQEVVSIKRILDASK